MRSLIKTNELKEKCLTELKSMLPYNELTFNVTANYEKITKIEFQMRNMNIKITKGRKKFQNYKNKAKQCLIDIYNEFEDEIQALFNLTL